MSDNSDLNISIIFPNNKLRFEGISEATPKESTCASILADEYVNQSALDLKSRDLGHFQCCELLQQYEDDIRYNTGNGYSAISFTKASLTSFDYFQALLSSGMLEAQQSKTEMKLVSLLDFLHSYDHSLQDLDISSCRLCNISNHKLLYRMLDTLIYLQNDILFQKCVDFLILNMTKHTCVQGYIRGESYSHPELLSTSQRFCLYYANYILQNYLPELSKGVSSESFKAFLNHPQLTLQDSSIKKLEEYQYTISPPNGQLTSQGASIQVILETRSNADTGGAGQTVSVLKSESKLKLMELSFPTLKNNRGNLLVGHSFCTADVKLYLVGGEIGLGKGTWNTEIYEISTLSRRIARQLKMPEKRRGHLSCCSSTSLYIFGGVDRYRVKRNELFKVDLSTGESEVFCSYVGSADSINISPDDSRLFIRSDEDLFTCPTAAGSATCTWNPATNDDYELYSNCLSSSDSNLALIWYQEKDD